MRSIEASDIQLVLGRPKSLGADDAIRLKIRQYVDHCSFNAMLDFRYALACRTKTDDPLKSNLAVYYLRQAKAYIGHFRSIPWPASFKNFLNPQQIAMMKIVDLTTLTPNGCTPRSALLPLIG